ncbi:hypothetical protein GH714_010031 [Hevea brasiliensis]|uniref:WAT1-related protein n=1 Tax=Hevea brasiliensis TaxID=3981 RepID=A0A6A6MY10_HEVBR|nr:hypothetical protein GH714_010031 [Hevea brasiliensis]
MDSWAKFYEKAMPFLAVIFLQFGKVRPKMTISIFAKILLLGLLEPTIDQNLYYTGMKYTTATFASTMCNILPAFAFLMAWVLRLEKVNLRKLHSQAKILGTLVTVGGAMLMTLINGPKLNFPWTKGYDLHGSTSALTTHEDTIKGAIMIGVGCLCWSGFIILQGVICSGVAYYIQGVVMKSKGPVFVTAFSPLSMVIVTILGSLLLSEIVYLGRVIGALAIVIGLYLVLWGKRKDQSPLTSSNDKVADITSEMDTPNQEYVAIEVTKVRPTQESV